MKKTKMLIRMTAILLAISAPLHSQDAFPVTRLTPDSTREGFPSWSPDGKTIVYSFFNIVEGQPVHGSKKIPSAGGTPVQFTDYPTEHPQWSPDGLTIVFDGDTGASIMMVKAEGGRPARFLPDSIGIQNGGLPCWSPGGSHIAFKEGTTGALWIHDVAKGAATRTFSQEGMVALPGCWTRDGKSILVALMDQKSRVSTMWKVSSDGKEKKQVSGHHEGFYRYIALSPDGSLLVYAALEEKKVGLWIMPAEGGKSLPIAVSRLDHNECPAWSPDGKRLAFASGRSGHGDIYIMDVDIGNIKAGLRLPDR